MHLGPKRHLLVLLLLAPLGTGMAAFCYLDLGLKPLLFDLLAQRLLEHAQTTREVLKLNSPQTSDNVDTLLTHIAKATEARFTLVTPAGLAVADSQVPLESIPSPQTSDTFPELQQAAHHGVGQTQRIDPHSKQPVILVAIPYEDHFIRVSGAIAPVERLLFLVRNVLWVVVSISIIAIFLVILTSHQLLSELQGSMLNQVRSLAGAQGVELELRSTDKMSRVSEGIAQLTRTLKVTKETFDAERARFEAILNSMSEGVLVMNQNQELLLANPEALRILGLSSTPPEGQALQKIIDAPNLETLIAESAQQRKVGELIIPGSNRSVVTTSVPLTSRMGFVVVMHDVTDIHRLENIRKDFVANVSHELRTPISIVQANAETLLDGALGDPERARTFVEALHRNAERLSRIISDLLDLSRLEAGRYRFEMSRVEVLKPVQHAVESIQPRALRRGQSIDVSVPPHQTVKADQKVLEHVLLNLLENSIKYTPNGGHVVVRTEERTDEVRLEVQDDGPGIRSEHRARIFERFYRIDPGRSRDMGGTGLGLAIVKHLVESMGGRVGVDPAFPRGSIFWVTLPFAPENTEDIDAIA